jgi:hypothetical protein
LQLRWNENEKPSCSDCLSHPILGPLISIPFSFSFWEKHSLAFLDEKKFSCPVLQLRWNELRNNHLV